MSVGWEGILQRLFSYKQLNLPVYGHTGPGCSTGVYLDTVGGFRFIHISQNRDINVLQAISLIINKINFKQLMEK